MLSNVSHTGRHNIPILYEREITASPPTATTATVGA
jgi:hypothetical protein